MSNKQSNPIIILLAFIGLAISGQSFAQETYIKKRWTMKISFAQYRLPYHAINGHQAGTGNYRFETNFGVNKFLETGIYLGLSNYKLYSLDQETGAVTLVNYLTPLYGGQLNIHLLPILVDKEIRFDLYLTAKYGGYFFNTPKNMPLYGYNSEYNLGIGLSFYPWKNLGINTEFCYGNYLWEDLYKDDCTKFRYGLTYKF